jgi:hypothetical protein
MFAGEGRERRERGKGFMGKSGNKESKTSRVRGGVFGLGMRRVGEDVDWVHSPTEVME